LEVIIPEGPETRITVDSLSTHVVGKELVNIEFLSGRYTKHNLPERTSEILTELPQMIQDVNCKGKFIYFTCKSNWSIWNTLGMSGSWSASERKHSRVKFTFSDGSSVFFNDIRNFGTLKFVNDPGALTKKLNELGPDMLTEDVADHVFKQRVRRQKSKTVTEALMNQKVVSGVGNYLKSESLYFAKISPHRTCDSLLDAELDTLNHVIKQVIRQSYQTGGATIYTFQNFEGQSGQYSRRLAVYNQSNDPEGRKVESFTSPEGRTTFWVREVQK
jgi:formamidopyrimidine-DNA glycosylase